ncbi:hypothetical protein QJS04_geneDACA023785 [Acorus gramineus]|uniref:Transcription factor TFIIIC triple barrel domain-containing protein n=1 Tax=Acorus gramineus TaxID=55184 RepID=A0AAV9A8C2_ACOGR|nr:hypothetical protein QJS04_geneDACA023785 [Acorus gramineus]
MISCSNCMVQLSCSLEKERDSDQIIKAMDDDDDEEEDEEFVLLDLGNVCVQRDIPANAPYVLSGLDTLNPMLVIGDNLKMIGEYEETIGTCFVFSESECGPVVHEEKGPSEANLFMGKCIIDSKQASSKKVKPVARLHKVLKFRVVHEDDIKLATDKTKDS